MAPHRTGSRLQVEGGSLRISSDIAGGNLLLEKQEGGRFFVRQELRDTEGWWFYWAFQAQGAPREEFEICFGDGDVIGSMGPAVSADGGSSWEWLGADCVLRDPGEKGVSFKSRLPASGEALYSFGIPYMPAHLDLLLDAHPQMRRERLCLSRAGAEVPILRLGQGRLKLLLASRHHACEAVACYAAEGLLLEAAESPWWKEHAEIAWAPFMDLDGVLRGDQGKNRRPHDHNRDYLKESYPSVAALKAFASGWGASGIQAGLDFHCPYIRGRRDECIHFVYAKDSKLSANLDAFCSGLSAHLKGALPFDPSDMLPFDDDKNLLSSGASCQEWMDRLPGMRLASTVEFPYAMVKKSMVSAASARAFGRGLARALEAYLS